MTTVSENVVVAGQIPTPNLSVRSQTHDPATKPTAAFRVLSNGDLIDIILSFDPDELHNVLWDVKPTRRRLLHLLNAALVSRAFYGPAMRYRWIIMESLTPLLKILPNFENLRGTIHWQTINGLVASESLAHMQTYATKIWHLRLKPGKDLIASHTLFRLRSLCKRNTPLFPALKTVHLSMPSGFVLQDTDFQSLNSVFLAITSPSLSALSITDITFSSEDFATSVLAAASVDCTEIKRVALQGHLTIKSLETLPQFIQLQDINLRLISCALPSVLLLQLGSTLRHLKSITLSLDDSTLNTATDPIVQDSVPNFNRLENIDLKGSSVEIAKFLGIVRPNQATSPLQTIKLNFPFHWSTSGPEAVAACFQECGRISPSSLRLLQSRGGRGLTLARGCLEPLSHCEKLETLDIRDVSISLTDEDIQNICAADRWNSLQILRLPSSPDGQAPSLASILQLSESCPNLHTLSICSDFRLSEYQTLQGAASDPWTDNHLQNLTILDVLTVERTVVMPNTMMLAIAVSRFLEHHFRRLVSMEYTGSRCNEWWTGVRTMMVQYRNIRAEMVSITSQNQVTTSS